MKKHFLLFFALNFLFSTTSLASAGNKEKKIKEVDELISRYVEPSGPGCVLAIVQEGEAVCQQAYGMMNLEYNLPMNLETVLNLGSVSKQFTAACILLLPNDNLLSLDDDIHAHIPEWPQYGHKVTIRNLLDHTSGVVDYDWLQALAGWKETSPGQEFTLELIKRVKELNLLRENHIITATTVT